MNINHYKNNVEYGEAFKKKEKMLARKRNVKNRIKYLKKYFSDFKNKKFLEVGSHEGLFLKELQLLGSDILGIEPSERAANYAASEGVKTIKASFEEAFANIKEKFDAIFLFHVLEHMEDAEDCLKKIKSLLKQNGFIFIEIPNIKSYRSKKYGNDWEYIYDEHLHYFSLQSLSKLLYDMDLKIYFRDFDDANMSVKQSLDRLVPFKFFKNQKIKHIRSYQINIQIRESGRFLNILFLPIRTLLRFFVKFLKRGDFILVVASMKK